VTRPIENRLWHEIRRQHPRYQLRSWIRSSVDQPSVLTGRDYPRAGRSVSPPGWLSRSSRPQKTARLLLNPG
jgi:hypothetical protein